MPTLSDYTNVYREALKVLRDKGYQVWRADPWQMYCAEKDGWDFMADSPTALLGVVAIYEHKQPQRCTEYWWSSDPMPPYEVPTEPERVYISRIVSDRETRLPAPGMPPEFELLVWRVVELLTAGCYEELEQLCGGRGLKASELETRVRNAAVTLIAPPKDLLGMRASKVASAHDATWKIRVMLWTREGDDVERSSISLELTIVENEPVADVTIDDIRVLDT